MSVIWKYPLLVVSQQRIMMPAQAQILSAQIQQGKPMLWVLVNPRNEKVERIVSVYGTGHVHDRDSFGTFIDTFQMQNGELIFHVFEQ